MEEDKEGIKYRGRQTKLGIKIKKRTKKEQQQQQQRQQNKQTKNHHHHQNKQITRERNGTFFSFLFYVQSEQQRTRVGVMGGDGR